MKHNLLQLIPLWTLLLSLTSWGLESVDAQQEATTANPLPALPIKINIVEDTSYNKQDYIHYQDADRISWSDFKGPKRKTGKHLAYTAVEIICDIKDVQYNPDTIIHSLNRKIQYQRNAHISKELDQCDNLIFLNKNK